MIDPVAYDRWLTTPPDQVDDATAAWCEMLAEHLDDVVDVLDELINGPQADPDRVARLMLELGVITKHEAEYDSWAVSWDEARREGEEANAADDRYDREREER